MRRALVLVALMAAALAVFWWSRRPLPERAAPPTATPTPRLAPAGDRHLSSPEERSMIVRGYNSIGQPLNEDGRPIGPPSRVATRNSPIEKGALPLPPPAFDNARDRERYRRWWLDEFARRIDVYETLVPRRDFPSRAQSRALLERFYDQAEPRRPGEALDAYSARSSVLMSDSYQKFVDAFGDTPYTIQARASDPSLGPLPDPPVVPPGSEAPMAAAAEPPPAGKITPPHPEGATPAPPPTPPPAVETVDDEGHPKK
jgi:hypothetical protein